jgi:hypothetical protein
VHQRRVFSLGAGKRSVLIVSAACDLDELPNLATSLGSSPLRA